MNRTIEILKGTHNFLAMLKEDIQTLKTMITKGCQDEVVRVQLETLVDCYNALVEQINGGI